MNNNIVVVVFSDDKAAREGVDALYALDGESRIELNSLAVITRNNDGTMTKVRVDDDFPAPSGTLAGAAIGSLIGLLGGTVGFAAGAGAGALVGLIRDVYVSGVDTEFLSDVCSALTPGKFAVVADIDEEWITPVDARMEALGGLVHRTLRSTAEDERRAREAAARRAELERLKVEHDRASGDRKAKLQARIDHLRARLHMRLEQDEARAKQAAEDMQAKIDSLQKRAAEVKGEARTSIDARIAQLRANSQRLHP